MMSPKWGSHHLEFFFIALNFYLWYSLFIVIIEGRIVMNKQIILEQCDKIKNVVTEATQNEEEARNNAEKFKGIKEENTKLLDLLNRTKDIYWEMERILRIIEIDKEYDNTDNELENLKINVKDLIDKLRDNTAELEKYEAVKETVSFYTEALKDAADFISFNSDNKVEESTDKKQEDEEDVPFSFDSEDNDFNLDFSNDIFGNDNFESSDKEEEPANSEEASEEPTLENDKKDLDSSFDFSSMYGFNDDEEDQHIDKQKVVNITDFDLDNDKEELPKEEETKEKQDEEEDNSLSELNDLFNYLNNDDSFNN